MAPVFDAFDVLLEVVLSLVRVAIYLNLPNLYICWLIWLMCIPKLYSDNVIYVTSLEISF